MARMVCMHIKQAEEMSVGSTLSLARNMRAATFWVDGMHSKRHAMPSRAMGHEWLHDMTRKETLFES
eukprot:1157525-Pelagomonas_calceolata.AAC.2